MIYEKFRLDYYDWDIYFLEVEDKSDSDKVKKIFKKLNWQDPQIIKEIKNDHKDGGWHLSNGSKRWSMILLYRQIGKKERFSNISHEKRHLEDYMLGWFNINDKESAAILSQNITKLIYEIL
jgi:hypothetical protein